MARWLKLHRDDPVRAATVQQKESARPVRSWSRRQMVPTRRHWFEVDHIDPISRTAVVQCGVRNLAISEAAAPFGLYYAPDPSSQIACTIGGNVAENSGGVHCLKYGLTLHNVLRVRGFTVEGDPIEFGFAQRST